MGSRDERGVVARGWEIRGGDLDDPAVARAVREDVAPRVAGHHGYLGGLMLLDSDRRILRSLVLWDGLEAADDAAEDGVRVVAALVALTSAQVTARCTFDVLLTRFDRLPPILAGPQEGRRVVVRMGRLEGSGVAHPATTTRLGDLLDQQVTGAPGCVGGVLLLDRDRPTVTGASFWADAAAAAASSELGERALQSVADLAEATSVGVGGYQLLVADLARWSGTAGT